MIANAMMESMYQTQNALRSNALSNRILLLLMSLIAFVAVPCVSVAQDDSFHSIDIEDRHSSPRQLQRLPVIESNSTGTEYDLCDLCHGLEIDTELVPAGALPNVTCGDYQMFIATNPSPTCRADLIFNMYFESCCRASVPIYECEENVHEFVSAKGHNTAVPPIVSPGEKLNVSINIIYQALESLDVEEGTATIFVTITLKWKDPRLAWDIEDYGTCTNLVSVFTGHEIEKTTIWIPDFNLLNSIEGFQTMPDNKAVVYADGSVFWTYNGGLTAFCAFRDLARIPFDELGCQFLFSGYTRDHTQLINYELESPDYLTFGGFDITYNEWVVIPELGKQGFTFQGGMIYYDVFFKRSTEHYLQNIVGPTVTLTYLSFGTFFLDTRVGERLGFSMALALVVVAQQIVTSGMTPISDQSLWLDKFVAFSFYWVLFVVLQSVVVTYLFYIREDKQLRDEENRAKELEIDPNEMEPLAVEAETTGSRQPEPPETESESPSSKNCLDAVHEKLANFSSYRKLDMYSLLFCLTTYTIYTVTMLATGSKSDLWLTNEPYWFDESSPAEKFVSVYVNGDPNNR